MRSAPTKALKEHRFTMRADDAFLAQIDDWRRRQTPIPSRAEAVRQIVKMVTGSGDEFGDRPAAGPDTHERSE